MNSSSKSNAPSSGPAPSSREPKPSFLRTSGRAYALLALSAVLMFLGFAGFAIWPLAFFGIVPALYVFDPLLGQHGGLVRPKGRGFLLRALFFGYVAEFGGFYFIVQTLDSFSGFPYPVCVAMGSIFFLFQGLQFVMVLALWARARERGYRAMPALVAAYLASEAVFPMLFEHYYGSAFHPIPILLQVADLGGPMMTTALAMSVAGALYEVLFASATGERIPKLSPAMALAYVLFTLGYGAYRQKSVEARAAANPALKIGIVQGNIGIADERQSPLATVRIHADASRALEAREDPDLIVWPESSMPFFFPERLNDLDEWSYSRALGMSRIETPLLFGGLRRESGESRELEHNTAYLVDGEHELVGTYDKIYLLAFGEYLPFGDTFPVLYDVSPMSGRFSPGRDVHPLRLRGEDGREFRLSVLICYEDIVSSFVRSVVRTGDPDVLINVTNDSWFGDTHEPWVHLHLARFRAIEHRRALVRATNSGVSAIIDPLGRLVRSSRVFTRESFAASVPMMRGETTLYGLVGAWPGWVALLTIGWMSVRRARRTTH